ncbi:Sentrin-specific protease 2 [Homalodisca vitripennis]|nr:Sentrin-specific protease 2 [Homalodisca vitripennis]
MRLLEIRSIFYATVLVTYSVDTFFFETWERGSYDRVKSSFKGINLFSRDLILFPLHLRDYEGGHSALIAVKPKLKLIRSLDSLGHPRTKEMRVILEFMERNAADRKIICNTPYECPKQRNATDCGAFVCAYAELFSAGDAPSGKTINPLKILKYVARALRRRKMSQEYFRAYGEAGERRPTERFVAATEEDVVLIRELSEAIGDLVSVHSATRSNDGGGCGDDAESQYSYGRPDVLLAVYNSKIAARRRFESQHPPLNPGRQRTPQQRRRLVKMPNIGFPVRMMTIRRFYGPAMGLTPAYGKQNAQDTSKGKAPEP